MWAIDLGTTNTALARWDAEADRARLVELPEICRRPARTDPLEAPRMVPSAAQMLPTAGLWGRVGRWSLVRRNLFVGGPHAVIGRPAVEANEGWVAGNFARTFKGALGRSPQRTLARYRDQEFSAREVARAFLRELLFHTKAVSGERLRELVVAVPVESYDAYRAEVADALGAAGVRRVRFIDEPVAAAIGYGLGVGGAQRVLVVDFGGGTLDLALVELRPDAAEQGSCTVLAKEGRPVGGDTVDRWLLASFAEEMGVVLQPEARGGDAELWYRLMLDEARRVKEALYFEPQATYALAPPQELRAVAGRLEGGRCTLSVDRARVVAELSARGLYDMLDDCLDGVAAQMGEAGLDPGSVQDVLMVGGSTLLPQIYSHVEARFGRDRVRAWQPFEAVAYGACAFAAGRFGQSDFLVHDYAVVTYDPSTHEKRYTTIVPRGTRFPTEPDFWKRQLVPTCALGEPEKVFRLVICEVAGGEERRFTWDAEGELRRVGGEESAETVVVPLNEHNPTLGHLDPPHPPDDRSPRLEVSFGVNANRWLVATVRDLKTRRTLMKAEPVVRVL